jgi:hypothetical protein
MFILKQHDNTKKNLAIESTSKSSDTARVKTAKIDSSALVFFSPPFFWNNQLIIPGDK